MKEERLRIRDNTSIQGPYLRPEVTETVPQGSFLCVCTRTIVGNCWSLVTSEEGGIGSLRCISLFFVSITVAVTIALSVHIYQGNVELVPHGSVATDSHKCSIMGTEILKQGGNAVDAAIASTLCLGVYNFHVTGLGGGGFLLVYSHRKQQVLDVLDFRETVPTSWSPSPEKLGTWVGVPGLLRGLGLAHKLYGKMPWKDLVMPSVQIARFGFQVPKTIVVATQNLLKKQIQNSKLSDLVMPLEAGQPLVLPTLANSLEMIANEGADAFYEGSLASDIVATVSAAGGTLTVEDLASYQSVRCHSNQLNAGKYNLFVPSPSSGGLFLDVVLKTLQQGSQSWTSNQIAKVMREVFRHNYSNLGDPEFLDTNYTNDNNWNFPEAVGSHVAAVDFSEFGVNTWFGSQLLTDGGFILNNALSNLDISSNSSKPGRRPFSWAVPIVATERDKICGRRLVFGAGDATVAVQMLVNLLLREENITVAVEAPRFHMAAGGSVIQTEDLPQAKFSEEVLHLFNETGFEVRTLKEPYASCNVVEKIEDTWKSHSDSRGGGVASRF
ncbi:glutathione hydrolase 1 proenzyme-like isoform X2 [Bacillus rossius redtenbacheri]|uniref:glutathione hydrolase 1 proenzyme-like isoform X2 n=1 Tax=Bacillus rossius redtenbacheri TaxID=93214 RepID=UPI002FDE6067